MNDAQRAEHAQRMNEKARKKFIKRMEQFSADLAAIDDDTWWTGGDSPEWWLMLNTTRQEVIQRLNALTETEDTDIVQP